ncbi:MAG: ABC transporter substrate-binding protein [Pseudomonadales bacterium]|jgi:phospholipid transport system substrate-binding protein|nr:ABC transporter substrate-binding protein [Pseudomonadales bacterium]
MTSEIVFRNLSLWLLLAAAAAASASQQDTPEELVRSLADGVLLAIEANRDIHETDPAPLRREIRAVLGEHVAFDRIADRVMGRHVARATAAQRDRFAALLAETLIRRNVRMLALQGPTAVEVLAVERPAPDNAMVHLRALPVSAAPVTLDCELARSEQGWVLLNLIIEGRDLGVGLEDRFAALISMHDGSIAAVLDAWAGEAVAVD